MPYSFGSFKHKYVFLQNQDIFALTQSRSTLGEKKKKKTNRTYKLKNSQCVTLQNEFWILSQATQFDSRLCDVEKYGRKKQGWKVCERFVSLGKVTYFGSRNTTNPRGYWEKPLIL